MTSHRLPEPSGHHIDRSTELRFTWNGRTLRGYRGDTITSALLANGVSVISRSMKYHRPRGPLTADYWDPNTTVQVGPEPNVRASHRRLDDGMVISAQNVWPSLRFDVKAANRVIGRFLTAGFYYKTFMRPAWLWPLYQRVLSTFAPGGTVDLDAPPPRNDKRFAHPDVVVAGGGPAGMAAAIAAAQAGASVMLVEHEHQLGGHLCWGTTEETAEAERLARDVADAGVEVLTDSTVTGRYEDNWIAITQRSHPGVDERLIKARAGVLVVAAGTIERPYVFAGNDLPGVMTSGAVRRLINCFGVCPGTRAVVLTANPSGDAAIETLTNAGIAVVAVADARKGETVIKAHGRKRVRRVEFADGRKIRCDLLVTAVGWTTPTSLLNMAGDRPAYDVNAARFLPVRPPDNVLATGGLTGDGSTEELVAHGTATGVLAASRARAVRSTLRQATRRAAAPPEPAPAWPADERQPLTCQPHPALFRSTTHGMVDYSEDVSSKDLVAAAAEGFDSVELLKRFTTATMGPSQGKLETVNTVAVLAEARGESISDVGTTVWRPPFAPISLGALAGRILEPVRVSALHSWHEANQAEPILAGQWIRPNHYGDPAAEVINTRQRVGIIDITPLGKLDLQGPDVPKLLNLLYTNSWDSLAEGSVRYGLMCADDGVVLDDGVTGRLGLEHYLMTTTSSGAATVWNWAENWLQTEHPDWQVHVTPVTTGLTSINVAGPHSRTLLARLTQDIDLEPAAFGYMQVRTGTVAGVANCVVWRIGFTGELSYELHVPSGYGLHVWEQLLAQGSDLGVAPFGLEAQRIMRLEKGHFIVGQDTDGLSKAPVTGLYPLLKLAKDDWVGKPEVRWSLDRGNDPQIVAVQPTDPTVVPEEAAQIVVPGSNQIIGRITSSRFSPTLNRSICLAQVAAESAKPGTTLTIVLADGSRVTGQVMDHHAHFDPTGSRLRG